MDEQVPELQTVTTKDINMDIHSSNNHSSVGPEFKVPTGFTISRRITTSAAAAFGETPSNDSAIKPLSTKPFEADDVDVDMKDVQSNESNENQNEPKNETKKENSGAASSNKSNLQSVEPKRPLAGLEYVEPAWGGASDDTYYFETVKNGTMVDKYDLSTKSFHVFGRLPSCDHSMDHPSLSRYHAVIQHCSTASPAREVGWYLYDLDSTHGTWINKYKVKPLTYHRLRVGYVVKFGGSTRIYVMQGPSEDQDQESDLSVNELKQQRQKQLIEAQILRGIEQGEETSKQADSEGCMWGMTDDDAGEEQIDDVNPFALPENESLYVDDPKKTLRGFLEREGFDMPEYHAEDDGRAGVHRCSVEIPIDTATGQPLVVDVTGIQGKKKDAVIACALEACRTLDRMGLLRQAAQESRADRKRRLQEEMSDEDDDEYLDRTGDVKKKRESRLLRATRRQSAPETFESLSEKLSVAVQERDELEAKLQRDKEIRTVGDGGEDEDELDIFMKAMKSGAVMDVKSRISAKQRLVVLRQQILQLEKLIKVARPSLPSLPAVVEKKPVLPVVGKMKGSTGTHRPVAAVSSSEVKIEKDEEFVAEEDDDDEVMTLSHDDNDKKSVVSDKTDNTDKDNSDNKITDKNIRDNSKTTDKTNVKEYKHMNKSNDQNITDKAEDIRDISDSIDNIDKKSDKNIDKDVDSEFEKVSETNSETITKKKKQVSGGVSDFKRLAAAQGASGNKGVEGRGVNKGSEEGVGEYETWLPPCNQSGDGRTKLNEKYGY